MSELSSSTADEQSFGETLAELDEIVAALEGGQLELEESMERYERGIGLLRSLQVKLADAQQKVTTLIGELEEEVAEDQFSETGNASDDESAFTDNL